MILPLLSALAFFVGVLAAAFSQWAFPLWTLLCAGLLLLKKPAHGCLLFAFLLGFFRMQVYENALEYSLEVGWMEVTGTIVEEVDQRRDENKIVLRTQEGWRILVSLSPYSELHYGDTLKVSGFLERPEEGSYANYLFRNNILYVLKTDSFAVIQKSENSFRGFLYAFKAHVMQRINKLYFEPQASLVSGLLLGSRKGMSDELTAAFQATGLTHIVAISGYNISLIIACIFALFSFFTVKTRVIVSVFFVTLFVLFVGASAAAVRAGIMGSLAMWALYSGRHSQVFFALLWSAVFMTLWNPAIFVFDIGFQLSFAATLGLLVFAPLLQSHIPLRDGFLKESLMLTLSAQITTVPFIAFYFGRVSLISPLANIVVAPFIPLAMLFSSLSLVGGQPFALVASIFMEIIIESTCLLAKLPFADVPFLISAELFVLTLFWIVCLPLLFYKSKLARAFGLEDEGVFSKVLAHESQRHEIQLKHPASIEG